MLIVVNADDLGTSEIVNTEIFSLMDAGLVTSATLIGNSPGFEHAIQRIPRFPNCSFGVHLNLTVLPPLGPAAGLEPILDEKGHLSRRLLHASMTPQLRAAAIRELTLQVERALAAGVPVSHFDSHEHIHTLPQMFPVLKALQRKFGIRKVRSTINVLPPGERMATGRALRKWIFNIALRHVHTTSSPEGFGEFQDFHAALTAGSLPRFPRLELMIHPGTTNSLYNEQVRLLRSDWRGLLPSDVQLVSYHSV
jgi:predicted glycoside hydrolase/deacetylase ChbG (UPF0249 family)